MSNNDRALESYYETFPDALEPDPNCTIEPERLAQIAAKIHADCQASTVLEGYAQEARREGLARGRVEYKRYNRKLTVALVPAVLAGVVAWIVIPASAIANMANTIGIGAPLALAWVSFGIGALAWMVAVMVMGGFE